MASRVAKIGPQIIAAMKVGDLVWDSELSRFGARRRATSIAYFVKVRIDGRQRWLTVGRHGPVTPAAARLKAKHVLGLVDSGKDPSREREMGRSLPLFGDFADQWLRDHVSSKRKPNTYKEYERVVDLHLKPVLGKVRLDRIDRSDALKVHGDLRATPYQANRVIAVLSAIMTFAERLGIRPQYSNPCRGIERYKERKRKRPLSTSELVMLWSHLSEREVSTNPFIVGALRLLILTGMRREEVLTLRWSQVDHEAGLIRLRDAKTGPRDVILSRAAICVLGKLPRLDDNPYIFPGAKAGQRLVNISDTWQDIRRTLGFPEVRIHDLRHTVASTLARAAPLTVVRDALGHSEIGTTSDYSHTSDEDVRAALESFSGLLFQEAMV